MVFQTDDQPVLYIGYSFTLHLVTFSVPALFVSLGDVALGMVLRLF
jgi:hypothetical protein